MCAARINELHLLHRASLPGSEARPSTREHLPQEVSATRQLCWFHMDSLATELPLDASWLLELLTHLYLPCWNSLLTSSWQSSLWCGELQTPSLVLCQSMAQRAVLTLVEKCAEVCPLQDAAPSLAHSLHMCLASWVQHLMWSCCAPMGELNDADVLLTQLEKVCV